MELSKDFNFHSLFSALEGYNLRSQISDLRSQKQSGFIRAIFCHSRESGNPWIPDRGTATSGMTAIASYCAVLIFFAKSLSRHFDVSVVSPCPSVICSQYHMRGHRGPISVVNIDDGETAGTGCEHGEERSKTTEGCSVPNTGWDPYDGNGY